MIATIGTPDAPGGIDVLTTHLNSRGASGVPAERADAAWKRQFAYLTAFIARTHDERRPLIVAGDLNVGSVPAGASGGTVLCAVDCPAIGACGLSAAFCDARAFVVACCARSAPFCAPFCVRAVSARVAPRLGSSGVLLMPLTLM